MDIPVNVLITFKASDDLVSRLRELSPRVVVRVHPAHAPAEISPDEWDEVDVLFTQGGLFPDPEVAPNLRWVQVTSAGVDRFLDNPLFEDRTVILTTVSGIHAVTMAEYALGMILTFAHRVPTMIARQKTHDWPKDAVQVYMPQPVRGSTLGIIGYGSIGRELARLARALGMTVLATKRDVMHPGMGSEYALLGTGDPDGSAVQRLYPAQALRSMLQECDYVVILTPLTAETQNLLNNEALASMKPGAVLINVARGGIIDEKALLKALESGLLGGAALDVFENEPLPEDSPLWAAPNLIISPHIAGIMPDYLDHAGDVFIENLQRFLEGREMLNVVEWSRGY
jgi:phosphoglycerate dehydrogenase-like enzyme